MQRKEQETKCSHCNKEISKNDKNWLQLSLLAEERFLHHNEAVYDQDSEA